MKISYLLNEINPCRILMSLLIISSFSSCTFLKVVWHNFSSIDDYKIFDNRELSPSPHPFYFSKKDFTDLINKKIREMKNGNSLEDLLEENNTAAFLVIKNDTLIYEKYFDSYNDSSLILAFSMTKSFLSILVGCAVDDGYIKSAEQKVTEYVPELEKNGFGKVTIKHLLQMTSGMDYNESDNPFAVHPYFYYGSALEKKILSLELEKEPGKEFKYKSGEAQLLGLILKRALKTKTITAYMQERLWNHLGMEYGGLWSLDSEESGLEKVFCCISARARDFAKFGRLYLNKGNWNGKQILKANWIENSTSTDSTAGSPWYYQYLWWIVSKDGKDFCAIGHLGQYLYINSFNKTIIVRLGESSGSLTREDWLKLFADISEFSVLL